ncbi:MAG TPA: ATP-binding protein, partial [Gaiellales bacterium]|nr:ATP-binding protein [Gaiellales bacterium]
LMFELRPQLLDVHGLEAAVRALVEQAGAEAGFDTELAASIGRYPAGVEGMTYRTVREAVANARRHSRARRLTVRLEERDGGIRGSVCDDGVGFDVGAVRERPDSHLHQGLDAVAERLRLAGGSFSIDTEPGGGTRVTFEVPIGAA